MTTVPAALQPWSLAPGASTSAVRGRDADTAAQFEQLLLRQWLQQVRQSGFEDRSGVSAGYLELADDQLAAVVAGAGGIGLAPTLRRWMQGLSAYQAAQPGLPG